MKPISLVQARNMPQNILDELGLLSLPVDIEAVALRHDILIKEMPTELATSNIHGALIVSDNRVGIFYSKKIENKGFQRFTIAHELGHYFLDGHFDVIFDITGLHTSEVAFQSLSHYEIEADHFAAGMLMPEKLCKKLIAKYADGLEAIHGLANECVVSITASAIRYIDIATAPSAIVISSKNIIEYSFFTKDFFKFGEMPKKGSKVPMGTGAFSLEKEPWRNIQELDSNISIWSGGRSIDCFEQSIVLGQTDKVLTVLSCIEEEDEEVGDDFCLSTPKW